MQSQTPPYAAEVILYRTRTDILSDYRFIVDGTTYPLKQIQSVRVVPIGYYIPLQAMRVLALLVAIFFLSSVAGFVGDDLLPDSTLLRVTGIVIAGSIAALGARAIPTHVIQLKLEKQVVDVMPSSDVRDLKFIASRINEAMAKLKKRTGDGQ